MIRHFVLIKFDSRVSSTERAGILYGFRALVEVVEGLEHADFGSNVSPEGLGKGYDHGFTMDFVDVAARDAYLDHPLRRAAAARLTAAAEDGVNGILVFDLEVG